MRGVNGLWTPCERDTSGEESTDVRYGDRAARLTRLWRVLVRRRMFKMSCRAILRQRCWEKVPRLRADDSWGDMAVIMSIASPRMVWRSLARERRAACTSIGFGEGVMSLLTSLMNTESSNVRAIAVERKMAVLRSTVTLDFHFSRVCSGIAY